MIKHVNYLHPTNNPAKNDISFSNDTQFQGVASQPGAGGGGVVVLLQDPKLNSDTIFLHRFQSLKRFVFVHRVALRHHLMLERTKFNKLESDCKEE